MRPTINRLRLIPLFIVLFSAGLNAEEIVDVYARQVARQYADYRIPLASEFAPEIQRRTPYPGMIEGTFVGQNVQAVAVLARSKVTREIAAGGRKAHYYTLKLLLCAVGTCTEIMSEPVTLPIRRYLSKRSGDTALVCYAEPASTVRVLRITHDVPVLVSKNQSTAWVLQDPQRQNWRPNKTDAEPCILELFRKTATIDGRYRHIGGDLYTKEAP